MRVPHMNDKFCNQEHQLMTGVAAVEKNQRRVLSVVILTFITMLVEIIAGRLTGSMALEADGFHMASHAGALGIAYFAYHMMSSPRLAQRLNFGAGKVLALGGYSSALALAAVALWMVFESASRFLTPKHISFDEALMVTAFGLVINLLSAWLLGWGTHEHDSHMHDQVHNIGSQSEYHAHASHCDHHLHHHENHKHAHTHHDPNHHGALMHVLADIVTSVLAFVALFLGRFYPQAAWLDPMMGVIGALVIMRWSWALLRQTSFELLDCHPTGFSLQALKDRIERDGHKVWDLHVWSQGKGAFIGLLSVTPAQEESDFRSYFSHLGPGLHLSVEKISQ